jgi:hypothetical protein
MKTAPNNPESALRRLQADGLAARDGDVLRTTRKWQSAMAPAALRLYEAGDPGHDLRVPIVSALLEIYGACVDDEELAALAHAILPVEAHSLGLGGRS